MKSNGQERVDELDADRALTPAQEKHCQPAPVAKHKVGITLQFDIEKQVDALWETLCRIENPKPPKWSVYADLIARGLECTDLATGKRKSEPPSRRPCVPLFSEEVDLHQFTEDTALFALMDASWMMLWAALPTNECIHVNPRLAKYTGRGVDQFLGGGWTEILHRDDRDRVCQTYLTGFRGRHPFRYVYRMERGDGIYGWIFDIAQPRYRPDGEFAGYVGTMYEISSEYDPSKLPDSILLARPAPVNGALKE